MRGNFQRLAAFFSPPQSEKFSLFSPTLSTRPSFSVFRAIGPAPHGSRVHPASSCHGPDSHLPPNNAHAYTSYSQAQYATPLRGLHANRGKHAPSLHSATRP